MLEINNIDVFYGAIQALQDVSMKVEKGTIATIIGANGAGKSTTLKTISGLLRPRKGSILFKGTDISKKRPDQIVSFGISHVPEGRRVFPELSVLENLEMGAYIRKDKKAVANDIENIFARLPRLQERKHQMAGTLSGGEQQMLAIGRALMSKPELLLMDEPSMGLAPLLVKDIFDIIQEINSQGTTILLVEQNARLALSIAHQAYVMETGKIVLTGLPDQLINSDDVKKAYLGG